MRQALIVSPFASSPADAGHRRRVLQATRLLKENGYRITFILLAFEDDWYWSFDRDGYEQMKRDWHEVIVIPAARNVALPPKNGEHHELDEWWDPLLEQTVANLCSRRHFDVVVAHNVWLSKVFDCVPSTTVKVLETHDLFWRRPDIFRRAGLQPEFFMPSEAAELFGINRSDVVMMIQESEAIELVRRTSRSIVTLPYYDPELEQEAPPLERYDYLHPEKVSFGFLGSANGFNVRGMNALAAALEKVIIETYAPVELVVGGAVGRHLTSRLPMRLLGRVPREADLYLQADIAIAPVFDGTGFKIKTADVLALGMPMLAAEHAAEGIALDPSLVFPTPEALARRMAEIALQRPPLAPMRNAVLEARTNLREQVARGERNALRALRELHPPVAFNLTGAGLEEDVLMLMSVVSRAREIASYRPVLLVVERPLHALLRGVLMPGVKVILREDYLGHFVDSPGSLVVEMGTSEAEMLPLGAGSARESEPFWRHWEQPAPPCEGIVARQPLFSSDLSWDPAADRLRQSWVRQLPEARPAEHRLLLAFTAPGTGGGAVQVQPGRAMQFIEIADRQAVSGALMRLLTGPVDAVECVWAAPAGCGLSRIVVELCTMARVPLWGAPQDAFLFQGRPSPQGAKEARDRAAQALRAHFRPAA